MEMPGQRPVGPYQPAPYPTAPYPPAAYRTGARRYGAERVGDVERSEVCDALSAHFAAGRLSADDLEYRLTMAVQATTQNDLHRLIADLPASSPPASPAPGPRPQPGSQRAWPALSVLAVLALIGSFLVAGVMLMVLGAVEPFLFIAACFGGTAAAVGGASGAYLLMRHVQLRRGDE